MAYTKLIGMVALGVTVTLVVGIVWIGQKDGAVEDRARPLIAIGAKVSYAYDTPLGRIGPRTGIDFVSFPRSASDRDLLLIAEISELTRHYSPAHSGGHYELRVGLGKRWRCVEGGDRRAGPPYPHGWIAFLNAA